MKRIHLRNDEVTLGCADKLRHFPIAWESVDNEQNTMCTTVSRHITDNIEEVTCNACKVYYEAKKTGKNVRRVHFSADPVPGILGMRKSLCNRRVRSFTEDPDEVTCGICLTVMENMNKD